MMIKSVQKKKELDSVLMEELKAYRTKNVFC